MNHRWLSQDENYVSCFVCGVLAVDTDPTDVSSVIVGGDGNEIVDCTGNTDTCHHYAGECPNDACHIDPDCNCCHCH